MKLISGFSSMGFSITPPQIAIIPPPHQHTLFFFYLFNPIQKEHPNEKFSQKPRRKNLILELKNIPSTLSLLHCHKPIHQPLVSISWYYCKFFDFFSLVFTPTSEITPLLFFMLGIAFILGKICVFGFLQMHSSKQCRYAKYFLVLNYKIC